jgi:hypothetical protein
VWKWGCSGHLDADPGAALVVDQLDLAGTDDVLDWSAVSVRGQNLTLRQVLSNLVGRGLAMTPQEALECAQQLFQAGHYIVSWHARKQMRERNATERDLRHAVLYATGCRAGHSGRWMIEGTDRDGDSLTVVAEIHENLVIITVRE